MNTYKGFQLNYVGNNTSRLSVLYSLMIRQYAISQTAFEYWDQLRISSSNGGGLYEKQPLPVRGNLSVTNDPGREVLGTFNAVSIRKKRIFVGAEIPTDFEAFCSAPKPLGKGGFPAAAGSDTIVYFIMPYMFTLDRGCVDCRARGGTIVKPDFWPQ